MGLRINTNVSALGVTRNLRHTGETQDSAHRKLSSGSRVTRAGDDAAALAISEKTKANIRSIRQGARNANDGIGVTQTAEAALNEVSANMVRIRELSIQAASGTYGDNERSYIQAEAVQLVKNIRAIMKSAVYNGMPLFTPPSPYSEVHVGVNNSPEADRVAFELAAHAKSLSSLKLESIDMRTQAAAQHNLDFIDSQLYAVAEARATLGATQNRLEISAENAMISHQNWSAGYSRMRDADIAAEHSEMVKAQLQTQMGTAMLAQSTQLGANALRLLSND